MGKGTIVFEDSDEGDIKVTVSFDPPLDAENNNATPAQWCLLDKWQKIQQMAMYEGDD